MVAWPFDAMTLPDRKSRGQPTFELVRRSFSVTPSSSLRCKLVVQSRATVFNKAFCRHATNLLEGFVTVDATFSAAPTPDDGIPDRKINVDFNKHSIHIQKVLGLPFLLGNPVKTVDARNPVGRIPSLTITYIDGDFRIGRGGDGSLFILKKAEDV